MKKLSLTLLPVLLFTAASPAFAAELSDARGGTETIEIVPHSDGSLEFDRCQKFTATTGLTGTSCAHMGNKISYTPAELNARSKHFRDVTYALATADTTMVAGAAAAGAFTTGYFVGLNVVNFLDLAFPSFAASTVIGSSAAAGASLLGAGIGRLEVTANNLNPFLAWSKKKDLQIAESDSNQQIVNLDQFADQLDAALNSIQ